MACSVRAECEYYAFPGLRSEAHVNEPNWPRVAVLGAGAVGCYFGGMLARAGAPVTLIGRAAHVEAMRRDGLRMQTLAFDERVHVAAATEASAVAGHDVVLCCVKSGDTEAGAQAIAPYLAPGAVVVSLQNGVDNPARIRPHVAAEVLGTVVYVGCELAGPGHVRHTGRGDLVIGGARGSAAGARRAREVAAMFERAGVPCTVSADVDADLWVKLIVNCAYNPLSALARLQYGRMLAQPEGPELMRAVVAEAAAVARAEGVNLPEDGLVDKVLAVGKAMPTQVSSTAQDIGLGKRTEIDALNGHVARRGAALGVPTPVNATLWRLVKLLETSVAPAP
jgi:2-dehydropantoate 2-reductase